jgi:aminoglycoside 3-N-acetyltransferase I
VIVALNNGVVIGGLTAYELDMYKEETTEIFLYEIAVEPLYRRNGVAKELIESLKKVCVSKGIREMYVGTEKDNYPAIKLYKATGGKMEEIAWFVYDLYYC